MLFGQQEKLPRFILGNNKSFCINSIMNLSLLVANVCGRHIDVMDNSVITGTLSIIADKNKAALTSALVNCALEIIPAVLSATTDTEDSTPPVLMEEMTE